MTPFEWILLAALVGGGSYVAYRHYHPAGGTTGGGVSQTTGKTAFQDPSCQAQYNSLPPSGKHQIDVAILQANATGGAAGASVLNEAAAILRPSNGNIADCLSTLATKLNGGAAPAMPGTAGATNVSYMPPATGSAAQIFAGQCLAIYQTMDPASRGLVDAAVDAAVKAGGGDVGAQLLNAYVTSLKSDPSFAGDAQKQQLAQCVSGAAQSMSSTSSASSPAGKVQLPLGYQASGSGASYFTDASCQATYAALPSADKSIVDYSIDQANAAGGGASGAKILAATATLYMQSNPNLYGCLMAGATTMNGGPLDLSALPAAGAIPSAKDVSNMISSALSLPVSLKNAVRTSGSMPLAFVAPMRQRVHAYNAFAR